jgi:nitroreductase
MEKRSKKNREFTVGTVCGIYRVRWHRLETRKTGPSIGNYRSFWVGIKEIFFRGTIEMADFSELLSKRRSIRDYEDRPVALDLIKKIIRDSCFAPSSGDGQPWSFIIVNNKEWIKKLSDESKRNILSYIELNPDAPVKKYDTILRDRHFNVFYNAPCLVFIGGSEKVRSLQVDCALAACYFMFSACERGLGTCWVGLGTNIQDAKIREHVGMPKDYRVVAPVVVGYPRNIPGKPEAREAKILKMIS